MSFPLKENKSHSLKRVAVKKEFTIQVHMLLWQELMKLKIDRDLSKCFVFFFLRSVLSFEKKFVELAMKNVLVVGPHLKLDKLGTLVSEKSQRYQSQEVLLDFEFQEVFQIFVIQPETHQRKAIFLEQQMKSLLTIKYLVT